MAKLSQIIQNVTAAVKPRWEVNGFDASAWTGTLNFSLIRPKFVDGTYQFAYFRALIGKDPDSQFARNIDGLDGYPRGGYLFLKAGANWKEQCKQFAALTKKCECPPWLDVEEYGGLSKQNLVGVVTKSLKMLEDLLGVRPIIYTNAGFWNRYLPATDLGNPIHGANAGYGLAVANWWPEWYPKPTLPKDWKTCLFWQWSKSGKLAGAPGRVDLVRYYGTRAQFGKLVKNDT